jgi:hypothetical protein
MKRADAMRAAVGAMGAVLIVSAGAAMASAEENHGEGEVDVTVDIPVIDEPGVLAMSVAGGAAVLSENGSDPLVRQFTGTLPSVTVTDTRTSEEIPEGAVWYVLGTASDFVGDAGQPAIPAANLGWRPDLIDDDGSGEAFPGEPVESSVDGGRGLADAELLFSTVDSSSVAAEGSWTASAELVLRTEASVAPGGYASTITLSLFE